VHSQVDQVHIYTLGYATKYLFDLQSHYEIVYTATIKAYILVLEKSSKVMICAIHGVVLTYVLRVSLFSTMSEPKSSTSAFRAYLGFWTSRAFSAVSSTYLILQLSCYESNEIRYFFNPRRLAAILCWP